MPDSAPIIARAQRMRATTCQSGTVLAVTSLAHPPVAFGPRPRRIALVQLDDGTRVLASALAAVGIGQRVRPRMQLSRISRDGLRIYDIAFEPAALKPAGKLAEFPGYVLALTGPSGVGKSTVSRLIIQFCAPYAATVPILTTRVRRPGDDGEYRCVGKEKFQRLMESGEIVASTKIFSSTEDRWYGYRRSDIEKIWKQGKMPVVITEMHLLQGLAKSFGRRSILSFGLLPPGRSKRAMLSHLLRRMRTRSRETEQQIRDRLKNAEKDLAFFDERKDLFDHLIVNEDLDRVIEAVKQKVPGLAGA